MKPENEMEALKKENQMLRELLAEWPAAFTYVNPEHELSVSKTQKDGHPVIRALTYEEKQAHTNQRIYLSASESGSFLQTEEFLSDIFDLVAHHIVFIDGSGIITLCNLQAAKDHGVDRDTIIGNHLRELVQIPDEQLLTLETARTGIEFVDREVLDKNYGILNTRILRDSDGTIMRVIGTFYFLNAIKEAEKQAIAGRIAAGIAHEIRNPLTTVRGFLQVLKESADPDTKALFQSVLIPEIDRANKIITDFLSIAKPAEIRTETFNIADFLEIHLGRILKSEALLYGVEVEIVIDSQAREASVLGNKDELLQVFLNLFQNSFQAKKKEPLIIQLTAAVTGDRLLVAFKDNGSGIIPSAIRHIFDPFFSTKDSGTGLGLSVSKKIIENHKGTMSAESDENGTVFYMEFPLVTGRFSS